MLKGSGFQLVFSNSVSEEGREQESLWARVHIYDINLFTILNKFMEHMLKRAFRDRLRGRRNRRGHDKALFPNNNVQSEEKSRTIFEKEFDTKMGYFYTCPCCYQRYVSSECVEEHLTRCGQQVFPDSPEKVPQIVGYSSLNSMFSTSDDQKAEDTPDPTTIIEIAENIVKRERIQVCVSPQIMGDVEADGPVTQNQPTEADPLAGDLDNSNIDPFCLDSLFAQTEDQTNAFQNPNDSSSMSDNQLAAGAMMLNGSATSWQTEMSSVSHEYSATVTAGLQSEMVQLQPTESSFGGFFCPFCNGFFETLLGIQLHLEVCSSNTSSQQSITSSIPDDVENSQLSVVNNGIPCTLCQKIFPNELEYENHMRIDHGEKSRKKYKCDMCEKSYDKSRSLVIHRRSHTGEKPFKCPICGEAFMYRSTLQNHKLTHSEVSPLKCSFPNCTVTSRSVTTLSKHRKTHTQLPPNSQVKGKGTGKRNTGKRRRKKSESSDPDSPVQVITIDDD